MSQTQRLENYRRAYEQALHLAQNYSDDPVLESNPVLLFIRRSGEDMEIDRPTENAERWFDDISEAADYYWSYPYPRGKNVFPNTLDELRAMDYRERLGGMSELFIKLAWTRLFSITRRRCSKERWATTDWCKRKANRIKGEYKQVAKEILKLHSFAVAYGRDPVPYLADHPSTKAALEAREQMLAFKELGESEAAF